MTEQFDALVVGAGPAGSAAAIHLARGGARVLLAERASFPRDKPCGGGVTGRALRQAPCAIGPVVEDEVRSFEVRLRYRERFERRSGTPVILMTQRRRLDAFLAEQAATEGADLRDGAKVEDLSIGPDGVTARVGGHPVRAGFVVGADGANGTVARTAELGNGIVRGVALEANVPWGKLERSRYVGRAVIELAVVPGGYGWVFAKGTHANVGVGGWGSEGRRLREHLDRLVRAHGLRYSDLRDVRGHRLPMRPTGAKAHSDRVALVGDAAGLVDPLSGDGIYEAFVSARLAAEAILAGDLDGYSAALSAVLDRHAEASWAAKRALDKHPALCFWAARSPGVFNVVAGLLRGDVRHPREARGLSRPPLRLIARLARSR